MASLMAPSTFGTSNRRSSFLRIQRLTGIHGLGSVFLGNRKWRISCSAKSDTLEKVCGIVKKQLTLHENASVEADSKFAQLGADSLDTVEIMLTLEDAFGISMDEERAEKIVTVQDAADLIDDLLAHN